MASEGGTVPDSDERHQMTFAVGCYHFNLQSAPDSPYTVDEYLSWLDLVLSGLPNVTWSNIDAPEGAGTEVVGPETRQGELAKLWGFSPLLSGVRLEYELVIPYRVQSEIASVMGSPLHTGTERFSVVTEYHRMPLTLVRPIAPKGYSIPSDSLQMVRGYLEQEVPKVGDHPLEFRFLGAQLRTEMFLAHDPSAPIGATAFASTLVQRRGWDHLFFECSEEAYPALDMALAQLFDELVPELDLFYTIHQFDRVLSERWWDIEERINALVEREDRTGVGAWLSRALLPSRDLRRTTLRLALFRREQLEQDSSVAEQYRYIYRSDLANHLMAKVNEAQNGRSVFPVQNVADILDLLEKRGSLRIDRETAIVASLIGGLVGAVVVAALT